MSDYDGFKARHKRLSTIATCSKTKYREFFYELDFQTYPTSITESIALPLALAQRRKAYIEYLRTLIQERTVQRARIFEKVPNLSTQLSKCENKTAVIEISKLIRGISERHFSNEYGGTDFIELGQAFCHFSNGELRINKPFQITEYEPDSGFYFAFGEFALLALELGIDSDFWSQIVRYLILTQEIFVRAYPVKGPRSGIFNIVTKFKPTDFKGSLSEKDLSEIKARYLYLSLKELKLEAGRIAHYALRKGEIPQNLNGGPVT